MDLSDVFDYMIICDDVVMFIDDDFCVYFVDLFVDLGVVVDLFMDGFLFLNVYY